MFGIAGSEWFVILIVALVVVGPKDLPRVMRMVGQWTGRARSMADQFRRSFDEMAAAFLDKEDYSLTGAGDAEQVSGMAISANMFDLLGARPALGRNFLADEDTTGHDPVVILSHGLWQRKFGSAPQVIGKTINLENYHLVSVWTLQVIGFLLGLIWIFWWTWWGKTAKGNPRRTVTNPAVTLAIPLNDDGLAVGLNTKKDHRVVNIIALATALFLLIGWIWQASAFPVKIPQQVVEYEPPKTDLDTAPTLATVDARSAKYDYQAKALRLQVDTKNVSSSPIQLSQFVTSTLTFDNPSSGSTAYGPYQDTLKLSPSGTIQPGQTATLTIDLPGSRFNDEHLLPTGESQLVIAGLLVFKDASGNKSSAEMEEPLQPHYIS